MMDQALAEQIRHRTCEGKSKIDSPVAARRFAKEAEANPHPGTGGPIRAYRCPFCGSWHLGHVPSVKGMADLAAAVRFFGTGFEGT